jgi:hypothetical protein
MYLLIVALTMLILPLSSISIEITHSIQPDILWIVLRWFVFWGVGVRLLLAGFRQYVQPAFTSQDILGIKGKEAFVLVRELGGANIASGMVGMASIAIPTFVVPSALASAIFYAFAGVEHMRSKNRGANAVIALVSDVFVAIVLLGFATAALARGPG